MIPEIRNPLLRRAAVVLAVTAFAICEGPRALVNAVFRWVECELDVDLRDVWNGKETK